MRFHMAHCYFFDLRGNNNNSNNTVFLFETFLLNVIVYYSPFIYCCVLVMLIFKGTMKPSQNTERGGDRNIVQTHKRLKRMLILIGQHKTCADPPFYCQVAF